MGALKTHSKIYYGIEVLTTNTFLNIKENGGSEITIELTPSAYSLQQIAAHVETKLNETGALTYTVVANRTTRKITISVSSGVFSLLISSGSQAASSAFSTLGFNGVDLNGVSTATSDTALGLVYSPQIPVQDYVPKENNKRSRSAVVTLSASGKNVSVQTYGEERFIKGNFKYITNRHLANGKFRYDSQAVENVISFLTFAITKGAFEFMPDESKVDDYSTVILESTPQSAEGVGFELKEYVDRDLPNVYETGLLVFRVID